METSRLPDEISFLEVGRSVSSPPVSLPRTVDVHIQGPCPPSYGVRITCVGGGSTHTALLDRVESKALRLISSSSLTDNLLPLIFQVASLSIFYFILFYRYFHTNCSSELVNCMSPPLLGPRCTRLCTQVHPFTVQSLMLELTSIFTPSSL